MPDLKKISGNLVFMKTDFSECMENEEEVWKLCMPKNLRKN